MGSTHFQDVTLSGQRFANQILRSHLQVASIGLVVVVVALAATIFLRAKISTVIYEWEPIDRAGSRVLAEVQRSLAGLRGWVALGDKDHLLDWQHSWSDAIEPTMVELLQRIGTMDDEKNHKILKQLRLMLRTLYISQWQVQDVARTPGNEPARTILLHDVEPVADELGILLKVLIKRYHGPELFDHRDHVILLEVEVAFTFAQIMLDNFIGRGLRQHESSFREALQRAWHTFDAWAKNHRHQTQEQDDMIASIQKGFLVMELLADKAITLRKSAQWNVAQSLMRTETVPLARQVLTIVSGLLAHSREAMDRHAREATLISTATIVTLLLLVFAMMVAAFLLSRRRAWMLAQPVWRLVHGAQAFAEGRLEQDIPVTTDNELAELTHSFNKMRFSLQKSQMELKKNNVALEQRANDLAQTNKELRDFVYIVSHDLRSPLVSIQGFLEELQMDMAELSGIIDGSLAHLDAQHQGKIHDLLCARLPEDLEYIRASTDKMNRLINAILRLSRLGHDTLRFEVLDLRTIIEQDIKSSAHMIKEAGVMVTLGDLPLTMTSDRTSMEQIFGNLFVNAIKYLDSERLGEVHIDGDEDRDAQTVTVRIKDNGRGIAQEDIPKIFSLFKRVGKQDKAGEGMGLSYVWTVVKRLGGKITCESTLGAGTVFSVTLPLTPAEANND